MTPKRTFLPFFRFVKKCQQDEISVIAGHLSFISLMAFVPFFTLILSLLSALPFFNDMVLQVENFLVAHLLPNTGAQIQGYLHQFLENVSRLSWFSAVILMYLIFSMMRTVEHELNRIFRCSSKRPLKHSLLLYTLSVLLAPILLACSIIISSFITANKYFVWFADWLPHGFMATLIAVMCSWLVFFVLYSVLPYRKVHFMSAVLGGLVVSVSFEVIKWIFNLYLIYLPTYEAIYGSLAILPIFSLWIYIVWWIILLGAELVERLDHRISHPFSVNA